MLVIWINKSLKTDGKSRLRYFRNEYILKNQYDGAAMFFATLKMLCADIRAGLSDIKYNMDTMKMSQLKHNITIYNMQIEE